MTNHTFDILLRQGEVIDPSQSLHGTRDVGIRDGKIARIAEQLKDCTATHVVDARGLYVVPGLIDLHVHVYRDHCPLSLDPDELCPAGGVTTMLDAGSAGPLRGRATAGCPACGSQRPRGANGHPSAAQISARTATYRRVPGVVAGRAPDFP